MAKKAAPKPNGGINNQLQAIVERIERLEVEKAMTSESIKEVYAEAKGNGFDVKALRTIIRLRKQDADEVEQQEAIIEIYKQALGMLVGTPLGDSAVQRAKKPSRVSGGFAMSEEEFADEQAAHASALAEHGLDE